MPFFKNIFQISFIEKEAFYSLHNLKYLYLQGNYLQNIEGNMKSGQIWLDSKKSEQKSSLA